MRGQSRSSSPDVFCDRYRNHTLDAGLTHDEHFSVDGTLVESYASIKSFKPMDGTGDEDGSDLGNGFKPRNPEVNFHGQKRSNKTHRSTTAPETRLYKKGNGQGAKLYRMGHALSENHHGLLLPEKLQFITGKRFEPDIHK